MNESCDRYVCCCSFAGSSLVLSFLLSFRRHCQIVCTENKKEDEISLSFSLSLRRRSKKKKMRREREREKEGSEHGGEKDK